MGNVFLIQKSLYLHITIIKINKKKNQTPRWGLDDVLSLRTKLKKIIFYKPLFKKLQKKEKDPNEYVFILKKKTT